MIAYLVSAKSRQETQHMRSVSDKRQEYKMKFLNRILNLSIILSFLSCSHPNYKGKYLGIHIEPNGENTRIDSIWSNYRVSKYINHEFNFIHQYHFQNDSIPYEYAFILNDTLRMKTVNLNEEEKYKIGSNLFLLSNKMRNDTSELLIVAACPYIQKPCLQIDITTRSINGITDTIQSNYNPRGDIIQIDLTGDSIKYLNLQSFFCDKEIDELAIVLD